MEQLVPYLGISIVVIAASVALILLARNNIFLKRLKYRRTLLDFFKPRPEQSESTPFRAKIELEAITLGAQAEHDLETLRLSAINVRSYVLSEAVHHPQLFRNQFSSVPLIFGEHVLILSWNGNLARIERVLSRPSAYPTNDIWFECLSLYRQAFALPYRQPSASNVAALDLRKAVNHYQRTIESVGRYLQLYISDGAKPSADASSLGHLLFEAKQALVGNDNGKCVASLEALLSNVHKLLLNSIPNQRNDRQGIRDATRRESKRPRDASVLIVDDLQDFSEMFARLLERENFAVEVASNPGTAIRAITECHFDLVIVDLVLMDMLDSQPLDAREILIAAKKISRHTRTMIVTAYGGIAYKGFQRGGDVEVDAILDKARLSPKEFVDTVRRVLAQRNRSVDV